MRGRKWHQLLGKHAGYTQSLYHHTLAQLNVLVAARPVLSDDSAFGLTDKQFLALFVAALCHDAGKESPEWQKAVREGHKPPDHVHYWQLSDLVKEWARRLDLTEESWFVSAVLAAVGLHHKATQGPASTLDQLLHGGQTDPRWRELADVVEAVDKTCSADSVLEAAAGAEKGLGKGTPRPRFAFAFHRVWALRGVSTTFLHAACQHAYVECGWTPALHFADGTLYLAGAVAAVASPGLESVRQKLAESFDQLLRNADLPQQVVGRNLNTDVLPKPELFNPEELPAYLRVAGARSKPANFRKNRKSDGTFSEKFQNNLKKYRDLAGRRPEIDDDAVFERFAMAVPLESMFRFFKTVVFGEKIFTEENWTLTADQMKTVEEAAAKVEGDDEKRTAARERYISKARKEGVQQALDRVKSKYEAEFGTGSFDDLRSVTNDPAVNLAKAVDHFLEQEVFGEQVKWASKPSPAQQDELIKRLTRVFQELPREILPPPLSGKQLANVLISDLMLPATAHVLNAADHLEAYLSAKGEDGRASICPWSNEPGRDVARSGSDLGLGTEKHSNRLPMQGKTWKNRGGVATAISSRYELMLRRLILGAACEQLIVLLPPAQLGPIDGHRLVDEVRKLEDDMFLHSRGHSPDPTRRFSFGLTDQIARLRRTDGNAPLATVLSYTSAVDTAKKHRRNLDRELQEAFGPGEDGDDLEAFNGAYRCTFSTWTDARKDQVLKQNAEDQFLRIALASFNEDCGVEFPSWGDAIEQIYQGQSDEARLALQNSDEVRERRRQALDLREPGRFVCQTPNLMFVLLPPNSISMRKDSQANAAVRQLFLSLVIANALGISVGIVGQEESLTFSGGEGSVLLPHNAALRSEVARVRRSLAALGAPVGASATHDWLLPHEVEPWLEALSAVHHLAGSRRDRQGNAVSVFPESSALYETLSARSAGFLVKRIEDKTKRPIGPGEMRQLEALEPFLG